MGTHTTCQILCSRVIYLIIAYLKTKQTPHKNKGKLESSKKMYFHKLNFYINPKTTNPTFIIHPTYKDTGLSTSGRHLCIELDSEVCTCHIPPICCDRAYFKPRIQTIPIRLIFQTSDPICTGLIHMSYFDQAHISNLGYGHMSLLRLFTNW